MLGLLVNLEHCREVEGVQSSRMKEREEWRVIFKKTARVSLAGIEGEWLLAQLGKLMAPDCDSKKIRLSLHERCE